MIHEIATITIRAGDAAAFESAVATAAPLFQSAKGCHSFGLERSIEHPERYRLVVGWESVEDHMVTFRESEDFQKWRALAGPFFASQPEVEHVRKVVDAF